MYAGYTGRISRRQTEITIIGIMLFKIYIAILFLSIGASLIASGFFLVKDESKSKRMVTSLTFRIGLSILLFVSLFVGFRFGWIQPHSAGF
ncbi:MAG: hypothetical protein ACI85N_000290 [Gammaproteobacteria bacterium]|jgi:hypothetical protein